MLEALRRKVGYYRSWIIYRGIPRRVARMERLYSEFIAPGDLCFDVGSHLGNRICAWKNIGAHVVALEPQKMFYEYLSKKYEGQENISILRKGASANPGTAELLVSDQAPTVSSFSNEWTEFVANADERFSKISWNRKETVELTTLDQMIERYGLPQFCKIDVEGFEEKVLLGLSQAIPVLSFEYIPVAVHEAIKCLERLSDLSERYVFNFSKRETMRLQLNSWMNRDDFITMLKAIPADDPSGDIYAKISSAN